jgi:trimethylamine:corrinoid methyltransferase-like protein
MENKKIMAAVGVLVLIVAGMFIFAYLKKNELEQVVPTPTPVTETKSPYDSITRVDAKHFFIAPTHTVAGEMLMPTQCDLLEWSTRIQESMPETVIIDFTVINNSETCAQVVTPQRFKVSFDASKEAAIKATLNGRDIELNLVPAGPNEKPEDFELFIKG